MPENIYYITAAYVATWTVVLGYLLRLKLLDARAQKALDDAKAQRGAV